MTDLPVGIVTFLMTDVEGSTRQWEAHPKQMRAATERLNKILYSAIERAGGKRPEEQGEGDSVLAAFPRASDAVACAIDIQKLLHAESWPDPIRIRVRAGIHTGEVQLRGERNYFGPPLNRCARLRGLAHGGQTLVSVATEQLIRGSMPDGAYLRDLGPHRMKDLSHPEHVFQLCHPDLLNEFPPLRSLEALPNNLPVQLTSFVGREKEMEEVRELITTCRLLTLTGAAGCGKTRLVVQVAADLAHEFSDGVWFVDLAAITDPSLLPSTTAASLSIQEDSRRPATETLVEHLREQQSLLIFDNCEHVLAACAELVAELLKYCPNLTIVATSREPLGVAGETTWKVPSLNLPHLNGRVRPDELIKHEGTQLFVERALAVASDFRLDEDEAAAVVQICRRLDGIPLAIELAAARVDVLSCEQIASKLDDQFRILTGGARSALERQQTMRAAVEWSYDLLTDAERRVLNRLSVFAGGFSLEAAEFVCSEESPAPTEILDHVSSLVRKSLVISDRRPHAVRYRLLESIKQYARDRLRESGEGAAVRTRHRDWYLDLAERAEPHMREGGKQAEWVAVLEEEHDNLRAALEWSVDEEVPEAAARIASALDRFWWLRGHSIEGRRWFSRMLDRAESLPAVLRANALHTAGMLDWANHDHKSALPLVEAALSLFKEAGDSQGVAQSQATLGNLFRTTGDHKNARALWRQSLEIRREIGDKRGAAAMLANLANLTLAEGDFETGIKAHEEALAIHREVGDLNSTALGHFMLGGAWLDRGEYAVARTFLEEAQSIAKRVGARWILPGILGYLGGLAFEQGEYQLARSRWEEAADMARQVDNAWSDLFHRSRVEYLNGHYEEGRTLAEEAASIGVRSGETETAALSLHVAAECTFAQGDLEGSRSNLKRALEVTKTLPPGEQRSLLAALAEVEQARHAYPEAMKLGRESLMLAGGFFDRLVMSRCFYVIGGAAGGLGEFERAAKLIGAARRLLDEIGARIPPHLDPLVEESVDLIPRSIGDDFESLVEAGKSMSLEEAVTLAMEGPAKRSYRKVARPKADS